MNSIDNVEFNTSYLDTKWILKTMMNFSPEDFRMAQEQERHQRTMESRILKLTKINENLKRKR